MLTVVPATFKNLITICTLPARSLSLLSDLPMDRRSVSPSDRPAKRLKPETDIAVPTIQYRNAVILAPMVRSGSRASTG